MYGWQRYLSIEKEFKAVEQYVPYELESTYSEFFTRAVILLGAEIEAALKRVCRQTDPDEKRGNIGQIKDVVLKHYPGIVRWNCTVKGMDEKITPITPFQGWDGGRLEWWKVYTNIKHSLVDNAATYRIAMKMLGAYEQLLLIVEATDPNRKKYDSTDEATSGTVGNEFSEKGSKAYTAIEMPALLVPDIAFGIEDGINGLPGVAFCPENVLEKIKQIDYKVKQENETNGKSN